MAEEVYKFVFSYGRSIPATTFADAGKRAYAMENRRCYIGVYDRDQKFRINSSGHLYGEQLMCQLILRTGKGQLSYIDGGCRGQDRFILVEKPDARLRKLKAGEFNRELRRCSKKLAEATLLKTWKAYVTAAAIHERGWDAEKTDSSEIQVDPISGRPYTKRKPMSPKMYETSSRRLNDLGHIYYRLYGKKALRSFSMKTLWQYSRGKKSTAYDVFRKAKWLK